MRAWIQPRASRHYSGKPRRRPIRPALELLEDRLSPAAFAQSPVFASDPLTHRLTATLTETQGPAMIGGVSVINAWTYEGLYNGQTYTGLYPGPTLWAQPGDTLDLTIVNHLENEPTNLHTHGLHVSPLGNSDNVLLEIMPGEENHYQIQIPLDHPQGLYWYHPHHHGFVNDQISMGLSGMLVIGRPDGGSDQLAGIPAANSHLIGLQNALLAGNQINIPVMGSDVTVQTFTVNGQSNPTLDIAAGEWHIFSVANIGNNAFYLLQVADTTGGGSTPVSVLTVGEDGNPFNKVAQPGLIGLPPGRRWSFVLPPRTTPGTYTISTLGFQDGTNNWPAQTLMTVNFTGSGSSPAPVTPNQTLTYGGLPNPHFTDLRDPSVEIAAFREVVFDDGPNGEFLINGQPFPINPIFQPRLGTVEQWHLVNNSVNDHPFHLHTNPQQVTLAQNQPHGQPNYQDVVNVPHATMVGGVLTPGEVTIRIEFEDYLGEIVYHCHRVDHEDMGMMALVNMVPNVPYYAVAANAGSAPLVKVFDPVSGAVVSSFLAYTPDYRSGVTVDVGDVNGDGVYDIITGVGKGKARVKVIDGTKLDQVDPITGVILPSALLGNFLAFDPSFTGGVWVAAGDINGDGLADIITGAGPGGGPNVKVVDARKLNLVQANGVIAQAALLARFSAYDSTFRGGVRVAAGDINGDGRIDIVTGAGPGGPPRVKVFTGPDLAEGASFLAFEKGFRGGVTVATGNIKGFAFDDIIVGKGAGSVPSVSIFSDQCSMSMSMMHEHCDLDMMQMDSFLAYSSIYRGGVRVTSLHDFTTALAFGANRDDVVTTPAQGSGTMPKIFSRTIPPS